MNKTFFSFTLGATLFVLCAAVEAQTDKVRTVGRLGSGSPSDSNSAGNYGAFRQGLRELGWIEAKNLRILRRVGQAPARIDSPLWQPNWFGCGLT